MGVALGKLKSCDCAVVDMISYENMNPRLKQRLIDVGFTPGAKLSIKSVAPLGDPVEVVLRGCRLVLRKLVAENIFVSKK